LLPSEVLGDGTDGDAVHIAHEVRVLVARFNPVAGVIGGLR
jgi:hypothetical protein